MDTTRRDFLNRACLGTSILGFGGLVARGEEKTIQGFDDTGSNTDTSQKWKQTYDRKVRVGIAGYGVCKFGAAFGFQNHPNVQIAAVTDLVPEKCAELAQVCNCKKTYPSLEEMVKDDNIEAVFIATDAPSHARLAIDALKHGKHVASAVPAVFGCLEEADQLFETVKSTGLKYMMFETSAFHNDLYAMQKIFEADGFGEVIYSEGEYYHYTSEPIDSYKGWRVGTPPQWYPTHSNAYYVCVTGGSFTKVSCMGKPSVIEHLKPANNVYKNSFGTEIALFQTSEGGMSRMAVSWDTPGASGEMGRIRGVKGSFYEKYQGLVENLPDTKKPPLPPDVNPGGHGGSHGYLTNEFIMSILENRLPLVNIAWALNMTVAGIVAHKSALKDGELLSVPQYKL
jgi:predicted dehydrogenase